MIHTFIEMIRYTCISSRIKPTKRLLTLAIREFLYVGYKAFDISCWVSFFLQALFYFKKEVFHQPLHILVTED